MPYEIDNLSPKDLKKLYVILNDIYSEFIITEDFGGLYYYSPKLDGVTPEDQKEIIAKLIGGHTLKGYRSNDGYILEITSEFTGLYRDVKEKIEEQKILSVKPTFDEESGILSFREYKILIAKPSKEILAYDVIKYIINESPSPVHYAEMYKHIADPEDYNKEKKIGKYYYNICQEIQNKIAEKTEGKITNFLDFDSRNRGQVKIDKEYL